MKELLKCLFNKENVVLTEVQQKISRCDLNKNQLILSSCGSGKTEAAFYLSKKWNNKTLYINAMKTLATSIHKRLNDNEKSLKSSDIWSIYHSSIMNDKFLSSNKCVTTIDQVLSGYLAIGVQSFIKGKNVVTSNFIFDEIQLFEPGRTLKTTICMLDQLMKYKNKFVIMTATMPEFLIKFLADRYDMGVTITDKPAVKDREVKLYYKKEINIVKVEDYKLKQIIICNSQKEQDEIYNKITEKQRVILLNNKLLEKDREHIERQVFEFFGKNSKENNKILITTQIVEAGMDISCSRMYCSLCPVDNLIQREGRVCRWGGKGEIFVFEGFYNIYDEEVCKKTLKRIKDNDGIIFNWDIQKNWVNDILNYFYEKELINLDVFKKKILGDGSRDDLIRKIENINIIVSRSNNKEDFKRQTVSISRNELKKLEKNNEFYTIKRNRVEKVKGIQVDNGETIIIQGNDSIYDEVGFRYKEGHTSKGFDFNEKTIDNIGYCDYIKEEWISHALLTKSIVKEKLRKSTFKKYTEEEIEEIATMSGLHDLGKLNKNWQKYIGMDKVPLAHNVYTKRNPLLIKDQRHEIISALALDGIINDKLKLNLLINHHGRKMRGLGLISIKEYSLVKGYDKLIKKVGYNGEISRSNYNVDITYDKLMTPGDKDWIEFVYLEGILMESDIESIKRNCSEGSISKNRL